MRCYRVNRPSNRRSFRSSERLGDRSMRSTGISGCDGFFQPRQRLVAIIELLPDPREPTTARIAEVRNTARFHLSCRSLAEAGSPKARHSTHRLTVEFITNKLSIRSSPMVFASPHGQNELHTDRVDDPNNALGYGFSNNGKCSCR